MKFKHAYLFLSFLLLFVFLTNVIEVKAMNTGFSTVELSEKDQNSFVSNISLSPLTEEPQKREILCFDVNEYGLIAVGQNGVNRKEVCVYNSQGNYLYGYTFNCSQSFGVEWDGEDINIYFVRSDVIISLSTKGDILDIKKVQNTVDNNKYSNTLLHSTSRTIGKNTYLIRNDMGILNWTASSYSQIVIVDAEGVESIIYDVGSTQFTNSVALLMIILLFLSVVTAIIIWQFVKLKRIN